MAGRAAKPNPTIAIVDDLAVGLLTASNVAGGIHQLVSDQPMGNLQVGGGVEGEAIHLPGAFHATGFTSAVPHSRVVGDDWRSWLTPTLPCPETQQIRFLTRTQPQ